MDHVAIMNPRLKLIDKILAGEKTIESRWYSRRYALWNQIHEGDRVYFKDSGKPVNVRVGVERVLQFSDLTPGKVSEILKEYGPRLGASNGGLVEMARSKRYCILIFLKDAEKVEPFEIDKKGFGMGSAWLSVENIERLKKCS
jgi:hypothetical protein